MDGAGSTPPSTTGVDAFALHSRPTAKAVIYLDFTGHTTTGTQWNRDYAADPLVSPPYDRTGNPSVFDASERSVVAAVWARVAEDYAPFDVDVTTQQPSADRLRVDGSGDLRRGVRVVITAQTWSACGCGGFAYVGSFNATTDTPAFVFNASTDGIAEAAAHEAGHTLYLSHDRQVGTSYYGGHGTGVTSWGPIMGAAYGRSVTQWSKGEYLDYDGTNPNSGKSADDLAVITTWNGFGYRPDDHGTGSASTPLTPGSGGRLTGSGVIGRTTDVDGFSFHSNGARVQLSVQPVPEHDLDVALTLRTRAGAVVATTSPATTLGATLDAVLPAGDYELDVDGVGVGTPLASPPTGYTEYGSLGQYTLSGSLAMPTSETITVPVRASADDAEESVASGTVSLASSTLELVRAGSTDQVVGMRFASLGVPHGAVVTSAHLELATAATGSETTTLTIGAQATDDAPAFTTTARDVSARSRTAARVAWSPGAWTTVGARQSSPDLAPLLQQVTDRPGWSPGQAVALLVRGSGRRAAVAVDSDPALAPRLVVSFRVPGAQPPPVTPQAPRASRGGWAWMARWPRSSR